MIFIKYNRNVFFLILKRKREPPPPQKRPYNAKKITIHGRTNQNPRDATVLWGLFQTIELYSLYSTDKASEKAVTTDGYIQTHATHAKHASHVTQALALLAMHEK